MKEVTYTVLTNTKNKEGKTALALAAESGLRAVFNCFFKASVDIYTLDNLQDSVLHHDFKSVDTRTFNFVLQRNTFALLLTNLKEQTPLHTACEQGNLAAIGELMEHSTPLYPKDLHGKLR